jgi:hypothetical protein
MDSSFYKDFYEAPMGRCMFDSCLLAYPFQEEKNRRRLERIVQGNRDSTATIMINKVVKFLDEYGVIDKNERGRFFTKHFAVWNTAYNNYKPEFKGYQIEHTFRVKGQKKEKILMKYLFMLDLTYNVIDAEKQTIKAFDSTKP